MRTTATVHRFNFNTDMLNEDFMDDYVDEIQPSGDDDIESFSGENTFRVVFTQTVDFKYINYDWTPLKLKSNISRIEQCVKSVSLLGDGTSDAKVTFCTKAMTKTGSPGNAAVGSIDAISSAELTEILRKECNDTMDETSFYQIDVNIILDFTYTQNDSNCSLNTFKKQFTVLTDACMQFLYCLKWLATPGQRGAQNTFGFVIFINETNPDTATDDQEETFDFRIGTTQGLHPRAWTDNTIRKAYSFLSDEEYERVENPSRIRYVKSYFPILLRMHRLKKDEKAQENYDYSFIGYQEEDARNAMKIYMTLRPKDENSEYAGIREMSDWVIDNIISKIPESQMGKMVQNESREKTVEIRVSVKDNDFKPVLNWKSKRYSTEYATAAGIGRSAIFKISFHDGEWDRLGIMKRGNRFLSNQMLEVFHANQQYSQDLKNGMFGREAQKNWQDESKFY